MLSLSTPLLSPTRGNPEAAIAYARSKGAQRIVAVERLIRRYYALAEPTGVNADLATTAAIHETNVFRNRWWTERLNAGSLGVTGEPRENEASPTFATPEDAADAHLAHLVLYATGTIDRGGLTPADDPRYQAYLAAYGPVAMALNLGALSGTYAEDRQYGQKIATLSKAIYGEETPPVATPVIYDIRNDAHAAMFGLSVAERNTLLGRRFERRNGGAPKYIVLHIQDGSTRGSLDWWVNGPGVQASATVMANRDGSILRVIPEEHGPWTNGDVKRPTQESAGLRALGGNPNQWSLTIEAEGGPFDVMPQAEVEAIAWQVKTWMAQYAIPKKNVIRHASINSVDRQNCPGPYYGRVMAILDGTTPTPTPSPPVPPAAEPDLGIEGLDLALARGRFGSVTYRGVTYAFNPDGPITRLWLARAKAEGVYPELAKVEKYDTRTYFTFSDGWTVWRANDQEAVSVQR